MKDTVTDAKDIVIECIYTLFQDNQNPTPEQVAEAIVKGLGVEQEWALAEYDARGNLDRITDHDYEFSPVHRAYERVQAAMDRRNFGGSVGMVSRLFTRWTKV